MIGERADVLVVGGGLVGVCCTQALASQGARVTLIERESGIGPPASASYANCGLVLPSHITPLAAPGVAARGLRWLLDPGSPFYIAPRPDAGLARWLLAFRAACRARRARAATLVIRNLNVASAALHDELGTAGGERWLYHRNGIVRVYETGGGAADAADEVERDRPLGVRAHELTAAAARERLPLLRAVVGGHFFADAAHLEPMLFVRTMAEQAGATGAEVLTGVEALALRPQSDGLRVVTTRGDLVAGQVVLAAGPWTPALTRDLGLRPPIEPAKGYSVDVTRPAAFPEVPLYLGESRVVLTPLGDSLRLGGTLELSGWDTGVHGRRVAAVRAAAERTVGIPAAAPLRRLWRGFRPLTPDGLPIIGRVPHHDRVIVAAGHCMMGLTLAPVTGRLVAELAGGATPSIDLAPLSPARFARL